MDQRRVIVAANRLPVRRVGHGRASRWEEAPGGLVTAMNLVMRDQPGSWVGWSGQAGPTPRVFQHGSMRVHPVGLTRAEVNAYYHGMSNRTYWPLYHDSIRTPEFHRPWWDHYVKVNYRFARAAAAEAKPGDLIWIHDYHLQLAPKILRRLRDDVRIGFFLHIPFPPVELFEWLPWRSQTLEGLLGADVVGFQTPLGAANFARLCREHTSASGSDSLLRYQDREVRVGCFPISIDVEWFESISSSDATRAKAADIQRKVGRGRTIILGVDRLDYTKGIDLRLRALEHLLRSGAIDATRCVLVQIAAPSRESIREYAEARRTIESLAARINDRHTARGMAPVVYIRRNVSREEIVAYYRAADVMLVTPLRDGMNLVAKEYVASRGEGPGTLVLSEFTGAAKELQRALLVNPRDIDQLAETLLKAVTMDPVESAARLTSLRKVVRRHDVFVWARSFMRALAPDDAKPAFDDTLELKPARPVAVA